MDNFKQNPKQNKSISDVDGFITRGRSTDAPDIRKRFRQNYQPRNVNLQDLPRKSDHFAGNNHISIEDKPKYEIDSNENSQLPPVLPSKFDLQLDDEKPTKKRFGFGRRKDKKKRSLKRRVARGSGALFAVLILGVGSILGYGYLKTKQIFRGNGEGAAALQANVDPSRLNGEGDGRVNILLLGKGGPGHEAPDLTDTILLASIDPVQNEAALLSVPRDMYVEDSTGYASKINAVYSNAKQKRLSQGDDSDADKQAAEDAGLKAVKQVVGEILGVPVHYYVMVDFEAFKEAIDTVGGITIDVKEPLYDATMAWLNNGSALLADEGLQTFDGTRALMYARSRYGSARGDFDRTERQREVIFALQQKVLTLGTFSNPFKVLDLIKALGDNVRTDLNGTGELKRLYEISQQITNDRFISVGLADPPNILVTTDFIAEQSVVVPVAGMFQYEEIQSYVRNTLRDAFLKQENARIVILNGTDTPGLATVREKELKSYGYNIVSVDNAPTTGYTQTKLIDLTGMKQYTASYLEKRLGLTKSSEVIEGLPTTEMADFVIILGSDEATKTTTDN